MSRCLMHQNGGCEGEVLLRIYLRGDFKLPLGLWCEGHWTAIQDRVNADLTLFDELAEQLGPHLALKLTNDRIEREPS